MSAEKKHSVSSEDYDPVIFEAIKVNANERKELSTSRKAAQQARFARGAEELDNAVKRAVDKDVIVAAGRIGETSGNNPK
ncbi:uncharacterized protein BDCG_01408 [Blastomyces dermatitidis ER-3]|uniref:Uncharacterized protein n=3 Tax=Blastomyces TaxID=229219 RepID=A0A179V5T6_BLAGS|nr:uncharacterized protein BDBG_17955 [Blastomyces gilchristii SLH14081]XP_045273870.1 uncharacterized protein BDCG_01408 [Blastomyces dermatitidis ER-3]EEQ86288.2 hypothetical protein BDCG_01408 [Blastomyces dermatitidis ER-3]EGE83253.2 hypothetical protein BDDG_06197 [Blastomyces dermatitidis ATCC 18188]OAT14012.1 hypothetical protein BDBG_17955 [Blastomyces gilchristii SLH14081]